MTIITPSAIKQRLATRAIGKKIVCLKRTPSTNDVAWEEAKTGSPHGTCVFAEEQTQGRGRLGRVWHSPVGTGLYVSILVRRIVPADRVGLLTAAGALAVVEAIKEMTGLESRIHFPNDVMMGGRKVAGILVESRGGSLGPSLFVVGIGMNVNQSSFPPELEAVATSLRIELGREVPRSGMARALLEAVDRWDQRLEGEVEPFRRAWRKYSAMVGKFVGVTEQGKRLEGVVEDTDPVDGLLVRLPNGHPRRFRSEHIESCEVIERR